MWIIRYTRLWLGLGLILVIGSIASIGFYGLALGPDFTGGSILTLEIQGANPEASELAQVIEESDQNITPRVATNIEDNYRLEFAPLTEAEEESLLKFLNDQYQSDQVSNPVSISSSTTISPTIGKELQRRALVALGLVLVSIIIFITYVFRQVSYPVPSVYYGAVAIIALFHDVIIPTGIFAILSHLRIVQLDVLFIVALLSILGTSVNDTIVVFDRIRENIRTRGGDDFRQVVGASIDQTMARSLYTSITILVVLGSIYLFGGASVQYFALALFLGIFFGTYSSIFIASPLLLLTYQYLYKRRNR